LLAGYERGHAGRRRAGRPRSSPRRSSPCISSSPHVPGTYNGIIMNALKMALCAWLLLCLLPVGTTAARTLHVVAAESFYATVARSVGGDHVRTRSILNNPSQDPHLFEASPADARRIADADVVIYNGLGYDTWVPRLLAAAG